MQNLIKQEIRFKIGRFTTFDIFSKNSLLKMWHFLILSSIFISWNFCFTFVQILRYFLWYLVLLPLAISEVRIGVKEGIMLGVAWIAGQAFWLKNAYDLEFKRIDTFTNLFCSSIIFVLVNSFIVFIFVSRRCLLPEKKKKSE